MINLIFFFIVTEECEAFGTVVFRSRRNQIEYVLILHCAVNIFLLCCIPLTQYNCTVAGIFVSSKRELFVDLKNQLQVNHMNELYIL